MNPEKRALLEETYKHFFEVATNSISAKGVESILDEKLTGIGTTVDEIALSQEDFLNFLQSQKQAAKENSIEVETNMKRIRLDVSSDENAAIVLESGHFVLHIEGNQQIIPFRVSTFLVFTDNIWKVLHYHGSTPVMSENDSFHLNEWKQRAEELEAEVKARTQELEFRNREDEVEVALERVRSRSLTMNNSQDLQDVINTAYNTLIELDISMFSANFDIFNENGRDFYAYISGPNSKYPPRIHIPAIEYGPSKAIMDARERGDDFVAYQCQGKEKEKWFDFAYEHTEMGKVSSERKEQIKNSDYWTTSVAINKYSAIQLNRFSKELFSDRENDILKRFGKVFEQAYTRFLDLQKAEEQARESQIEAALERIRSRSMAMHKTEELWNVIDVVFKQFQELDIELDICLIDIFKKDNWDFHMWIGAGTATYPQNVHLPYIKHPLFTKSRHARENKDEFYLINLDKKSKDRFFTDHFYKHIEVPENRKNLISKGEGLAASVAVFQHASISMWNYNGKVYSDEENQILRRVGNVFEQTYTRFLDLQKAEAQAREAEIELALERVRGMAMAMNHSDDINQIAEAIFNELGILNVNPLRVGVGIIDEKDKAIQTWTSTIQKEQPVTVSGNIPIAIHPMLKAGFSAWKESSERFIYELKGDEKENFYNRLSQTEYQIFEDHYKINPDKPHFWCNVIFRTGFLFFVIDHEPEETDLSLLERFGDVFQLAYTRFEDLQKVEEQTKDSLRKASLDRVRAEISSMRNTEDLEQITPLIWEELTTLDVPFFRCGIFIMDDINQLIHTYLSKPDGQSLAVLNLPYSSSKLAKNSIASWRKGEVYKEVWDQDQFLNWVHSLSDSHYIDSEEEYQGSEAAPEKLALHFLPFKQGMLYVGSKDSLDEDQIETAQSLANAFEVAYARYEDFQQLEKTLYKLETTQNQLVQQEKLASLGQLTAGIAHEIKNPLNFVNNFSELSDELVKELMESLEKGDLEDVGDIATDISQNLKKIYEHGSRADRIVKSMLQHSRYGNNSKQQTNLNSLVKEFVNLTFHGMRAGDHPFNVDIEFNFDDSIQELDLIAEDFSRVIVNLCNNAFDAMREKLSETEKVNGEKYSPKLTVRTSSENGKVIVKIEDNGSGIPDDIKDKIMQPFFTTKKGTDGTGLGLSITNDIIMAHGGNLFIKSEQGEKSTFTIELNYHNSDQ